MGAREFMNRNSALVTIAAVVVLVVALGLIIMQSRGPRRSASPVDAYYFDMGSGRIFVSASAQIAPIDAPSGPYRESPGGVRVYIFACAGCGDYEGMSVGQVRERGGHVAWLEMYDPAVKEQFTRGRQPGPMMMTGRLVKTVDAEHWVRSSSPEGMHLQEEAQGLCATRPPTLCYP